jgi:MoaA/NifB/PqqE/SkfB family radical SAM enzyme
MYESVLVDITAGCNAKCPLCSTARLTFGQKLDYIAVSEFERILDRLLHLDLATAGTTLIRLYNWGEPILHPNLDGIVQAIAARNLFAGISTNASKATKFTVSTECFREFIFSVPGWSQASQDKIHGFKFDRIVSNIISTVKNVRDRGYKGGFNLAFHVYQFNALDELSIAENFCDENGLNFYPYYAYIADYERMKKFLKKEMSADEALELSKTLFFHYVDELIAGQPKEWECPQWNGQIVLNNKGDVLLCCSIPDSNPIGFIGSIFDLSRDQIITGKTTNKECDDCMGCGVSYWGHNAKTVSKAPGIVHRPPVVQLEDAQPAPPPVEGALARALRVGTRLIGL